MSRLQGAKLEPIRLETVAKVGCTVGESPLWHPDQLRLYWVDTAGGRMFQFDPATGVSEQFYCGEPIAAFTMQCDGSLLLFASSGRVIEMRNGRLDIAVERPTEGTRQFNDVIADPVGRVFASVKAGPSGNGSIVLIERDRTMLTVADGLAEPNGLGFSPDRRCLYAAITKEHRICCLDYNAGTGEVANQRTLVEICKETGMPDGLTVDSEGFIWCAHWNGGCVARYDPAGVEKCRVDLPVEKPSSVTFGGQDYTDIYVSTSRGDDWTDPSPGAGALYRFNVGIRGVPEFWSRVGA